MKNEITFYTKKAETKFDKLAAEGWDAVGALEVMIMHGYRKQFSTLYYV